MYRYRGLQEHCSVCSIAKTGCSIHMHVIPSYHTDQVAPAARSASQSHRAIRAGQTQAMDREDPMMALGRGSTLLSSTTTSPAPPQAYKLETLKFCLRPWTTQLMVAGYGCTQLRTQSGTTSQITRAMHSSRRNINSKATGLPTGYPRFTW